MSGTTSRALRQGLKPCSTVLRASAFAITAALASFSGHADTLYGANESGELWLIDLINSTSSQQPDLPTGTRALANLEGAGQIFYFEWGNSADEFGYWEPASQSSTTVRQFNPSPGRLASRMAINSSDTLYAIDDLNDIFILNTNSGGTTFVGNMGGISAGPSGTGDIAFADDDTLYLANGQDLYTASLTTLNATLLAGGNLSVGNWTGLAWCSNALYGSSYDEIADRSAIFVIDTSSGAASELFAVGGRIDDLASCTESPNNPPSAFDQSVNTDEELAVDILLTGDDVDLDPLTFNVVSNPTNGAVTGTAPNLTYTPNVNFAGTDSFTFQASDGSANSNLATVTIDVSGVNDAPGASADSYSIPGNDVLIVNAPGVLSNDSDVDGDSLSAVLVLSTSNGTLNLNSDGSFDYTPDPLFEGPDSFTYRADDGGLTSASVTVSINVTDFNFLPVALPDSYSGTEDTALSVGASGVLSNDTDDDGDTLTAVLISQASNGNVSLQSDGSFVYTPDADFAGTDSFSYAANDGSGNSNTVAVSIIVSGTNDAPIAVDDNFVGDPDVDLVINPAGVLANDTDIDGDTLTPSVVSQGEFGFVVMNADGSFTYTPDAGFEGRDSFTYEASDGSATSNVATVNLVIGDPGDIIIYGSNRLAEMWELNITLGTYTLAGYGSFGNQAMEMNHHTGEVWYTEMLNSWDQMGAWDPNTGMNSIAHTYDPRIGRFAKRLAMAPDGDFYMMDAGDRLYRIDSDTAEDTLLGNVNGLQRGSLGGTGDMAFADDGTLYVVTYRNLYTVDVATRQPTLLFADMIPNEPDSEVVWTALAWCDGMLYGTDVRVEYGDSYVYSIDPVSGQVTKLFETDTYFNDTTSCSVLPETP
ncbi:MAG: Ig-like domain-containing protein [Pseudomonadaceae bacterium]|nr:Ig-like domain-containing protein [Pseudomonadaceae bacterium]